LFLGITYFGSEMILLMTKEGEEPTEMILQSSRWMAFAGKFFISGSFSVSIFRCHLMALRSKEIFS